MGKQGRLTPDQFGFTMPLEKPLFPKPPVYYRKMENIVVAYETDEDAALAQLPKVDGLELVTPATARIVLARMPFTTFGAYEEAYQFLDVTWHGEPCIYPVRILVNQESALAAGRELWGNPKKFGHITWSSESEVMMGKIERPADARICTVLFSPERPVEIAPYEMKPIGLRVIPNPELLDQPSLAEVILNVCEVTVHEAWSGTGSVHFGVHSEIDPWHSLPVLKTKEALYTVSDMDVVPRAKIVHRFDTAAEPNGDEVNSASELYAALN